MMTKIRKAYGKEFKLKVVSEVLGGVKTLAQVSSEHGVHATQVKEWNNQAIEALSERFSQRRGKKKGRWPEEKHLYEEIGRLKVELDFLSGKLGS